MTSTAWLSLGANIGSPREQLAEAVSRIDAQTGIKVVARSSILTTKPWGKTDQPDFANMTIGLETNLIPLELLDVLQKIELQMGRIRKEVWGPRLIDIDIIAYDRLELISPRLTLPHIHAHQRDFVLKPLAEIAPEVSAWLIAKGASS